jgi:hypothetical protein
MRYYDQTHPTPAETDKTIIDLRKRGWSYRGIGRVVGLDASSVLRALRRLAAGGPGTRPRPPTQQIAR